MRIREGHVSNSSSSSFILVTSKENFDKVYAEASASAKSFVDDVAAYKKIGNQNLVFFSGGGYEGGDMFGCNEDWDDFKEALRKDAESTYYYYESYG